MVDKKKERDDYLNNAPPIGLSPDGELNIVPKDYDPYLDEDDVEDDVEDDEKDED